MQEREREVFNVCSLLLYSPLSDSQSSEETKNENRCDSKVVQGHAFFIKKQTSWNILVVVVVKR